MSNISNSSNDDSSVDKSSSYSNLSNIPAIPSKGKRGRKPRITLTNAIPTTPNTDSQTPKDLNNKLDDIAPDYVVGHEERLLARKLVGKYLQEYEIVTYGDQQMVRHLVYLEVTQHRIQLQLNEYYKENRSVPLEFNKMLQQNLSSIIEARATLGLNRSGKTKETKDALSTWDLLKDKASKWRNENQLSRTLKCPNCLEYILLVLRTDRYDSMKHPFLKDQLLANESLIKLYMAKKLTKEDVSSILGTSPDYTEWLVKKYEHRISKDDVLRESLKSLKSSNTSTNSSLPPTAPVGL